MVRPELKIEQLVKEIIQQSRKQIILEVPENIPLLSNEINLRLIKFYAEDEEKELIINTVDPQLVALAQRLGISTIRERNLDVTGVTETAVCAQNQETGPVFPVKVKPKNKKRRKTYRFKHHGFLPAVVVALVTLLIGLWFFFQPQVVVIVYPKEQKLNFGTKVTTSPKYQETDIVKGKIPARQLEKITEFQLETVASGAKIVGVTPATGTVVLFNHSGKPIVIPKGAIVTGANGVKFKIGKNVLAPRKKTRFRYGIPVGEEYGKAEAPIIAIDNGAQGNQPAKSITKLEGKLQNFIRVVNLKPTLNGTDRRVAVVVQADLDKGNAEATRQMRLAASDELAALVGGEYLFFSELVGVEIMKLQSVPPLGSEAASVKTMIKYRATVVAPSRVGINKYLSSCLEGQLPPHFTAVHDTVKLLSGQVLTSESGVISLHLVGTADLRGILSPKKLKGLIKGKSIVVAKQLLAQQTEVADFKIEARDSRRSVIPRFGFQIKLLFPAGTNGK
jgi:hypothetical protein